MSTVLVDLPSRLADALNEQDFPMDAEATRGYRPVLEIEATQAPTIWVTPRNKTRRRISRDGAYEHGLTLEVLVQRAMSATTGEDDPTVRADEISVLAEAVENYLCETATITPETETGATPEWRAKTRGDVTAEFSPERYAQGVMAWVVTATFWLEK